MPDRKQLSDATKAKKIENRIYMKRLLKLKEILDSPTPLDVNLVRQAYIDPSRVSYTTGTTPTETERNRRDAIRAAFEQRNNPRLRNLPSNRVNQPLAPIQAAPLPQFLPSIGPGPTSQPPIHLQAPNQVESVLSFRPHPTAQPSIQPQAAAPVVQPIIKPEPLIRRRKKPPKAQRKRSRMEWEQKAQAMYERVLMSRRVAGKSDLLPSDVRWIDKLSDEDWEVYEQWTTAKKRRAHDFVKLVKGGDYIGSRIFSDKHEEREESMVGDEEVEEELHDDEQDAVGRVLDFFGMQGEADDGRETAEGGCGMVLEETGDVDMHIHMDMDMDVD